MPHEGFTALIAPGVSNFDTQSTNMLLSLFDYNDFYLFFGTDFWAGVDKKGILMPDI